METRFFALILFAAVWWAPAISEACDCLTPSTPSERLALAAVVFSGTVVETEVSTTPSGEKTYRFEVTQHFKGTPRSSYILKHDGTNCAFDFVRGSSYLVYAYRGEGLEANICSGTQSLQDASNEIQALERLGIVDGG
jgi:hypothetical protein